MRKALGAVLAAGILLSTGLIGMSRSDAAGGTTCQAITGTGTFSPTLPKLGSKSKVFAKLSFAGNLTGCSGGGVKSAKVKVTTTKPKSALNCLGLSDYNPTAMSGTEIITWNTGDTSTISLKLSDVSGNPTQWRLRGTVTSGLFKGSQQSGLMQYTVPKGGCVSAGLSKVTFKAASSPLTIR